MNTLIVESVGESVTFVHVLEDRLSFRLIILLYSKAGNERASVAGNDARGGVTWLWHAVRGTAVLYCFGRVYCPFTELPWLV